jgi:hypothetical protein
MASIAATSRGAAALWGKVHRKANKDYRRKYGDFDATRREGRKMVNKDLMWTTPNSEPLWKSMASKLGVPHRKPSFVVSSTKREEIDEAIGMLEIKEDPNVWRVFVRLELGKFRLSPTRCIVTHLVIKSYIKNLRLCGWGMSPILIYWLLSGTRATSSTKMHPELSLPSMSVSSSTTVTINLMPVSEKLVSGNHTLWKA